VYHSYRLQVRNACLTVTGTVASVSYEDDGDVHVDLAVATSESYLLNQANLEDEDGDLVTEIVPADEPGCTPGQPPVLPSTAYTSSSYNYGICTGAGIETPAIGSQVAVTGPYVFDADHGWMEIHPVWAINVLSGPPAATAPSATGPAPPTSATATSPGGAPSSGAAWCRATASPANDGYSGDYDVSITSNQPDQEATVSNGTHSHSDETDSSGSLNMVLYYTSPGDTITVTIGGASCATTA
jgi:hypothetical protein